MKTCLVTGGLGFIGTNFIKYLAVHRKDIAIINVDSVTYAANPCNIDEKTTAHYKFYKVDIANNDGLAEVFKKNKIDYVVNFAAESHVDRSIVNPAIFVKTNIEGTLNLLKLSLEHNIEKFLQISTDEVYGSLGKDGLFTEMTPLSPRSPYSASKASADMLVMSFFHTYGMPVLITRCSNNYGQYQFPEKLIPLTIINALTGKDIPLYGDGKNIRDWIYVDDHVRGVLDVLENGRLGEIYNIGGCGEMQNIDIITLILKKLNKPLSLIKYVKDRAGHDRRYAMDFSKISEELGFNPQLNLNDGLDMTISWYLKNEDWWKKIISGDYRHYYKTMYEMR
ncbi:MAG: dTDP-glucose 4,6-dehydratase [Candidatus Acididesulfobacter guangdongensis]|uniref:dTDP-glucose 4,6-dehydratase n=1 Tax=Acididesulfobacter guangdongensis TaxID=2597225 RepID=A0A519BIA9_ACIG2|nr:MAG: dTDP-glucose 4,6-dehydratase [Candidatus Acididesulfobacter guangdongensis]